MVAEAQTLTSQDDDDPLQEARTKEVASHLDDLVSWLPGLIHLLDSTIYPVSVVEKIFKPSSKPGWRYELAELKPVPYRLFDYTEGRLKIRDVGPDGEPLGSLHELDPFRYIVHRGHLLTSVPDTWGGPLRSVIFWWLFAVQDRDWWARFLERFGSPFLKGTYNKSDSKSRYLLQQAFAATTRLFGIAVPDDADVEIHQVNTSSGGDAFEKFHACANREISKIVLGQTLSAEGQNLGLGGGQASAQENVRSDIRQYDAMMLGSTVRTQILAPLYQLNGWPNPPRISWGGEDPDTLNLTGNLLGSLRQAGIRVTEEGLDQLSRRLGIPLERDAAATAPGLGQLSALSSPEPRRVKSADVRQAVDEIAENVSPTLSQELAKTLSPLAAIVSEATSLVDLERKLLEAVPTLDHTSAAKLAESALVTSALNAASTFREV